MNVEELRAAYPGAADAVVLHEARFPKAIWSAMRFKGTSPTEVVRIMQGAADDTLEVIPGFDLGAVRPQLNHPDFLRYVTAKLGAV